MVEVVCTPVKEGEEEAQVRERGSLLPSPLTGAKDKEF